jgi:hypothetical protein
MMPGLSSSAVGVDSGFDLGCPDALQAANLVLDRNPSMKKRTRAPASLVAATGIRRRAFDFAVLRRTR